MSASGSAAAGKGGKLQRKILIMGSRSVGKSSLTTQYVEPNTFAESYYPTIEAVHNKEIVHDGITYDCEIIDTAGQDEYSLFNHKYAVGIHGYVLVYSIASRQSFDMIANLHDKITEFQGVNKVCCVVVGQKSDLGEARQVKYEEGAALAKKLGASFIETSAKDNKHISDVFNLLMVEMRKVYNPPEEKKKTSWWGSWLGGGK
jgi:Ras family protein